MLTTIYPEPFVSQESDVLLCWLEYIFLPLNERHELLLKECGLMHLMYADTVLHAYGSFQLGLLKVFGNLTVGCSSVETVH